VVCVTDGGANRHAARRPVVGAIRVARFHTNLTQRYRDEMTAENATINGEPGVIAWLNDEIDFVAAFEVDEGLAPHGPHHPQPGQAPVDHLAAPAAVTAPVATRRPRGLVRLWLRPPSPLPPAPRPFRPRANCSCTSTESHTSGSPMSAGTAARSDK